MQRYFDVVQNRQGTAVVGATVTVYDSNGNLATLYSTNSGTAPTSNPVYTNADGEYAFYAANGTYTLQIAATGYAGETKPGVVLFDPKDAQVVFLSKQNTPTVAGQVPGLKVGIGSGTEPGWVLNPAAGDFVAIYAYASSSSVRNRVWGINPIIDVSGGNPATVWAIEANINLGTANAPDPRNTNHALGIDIVSGGTYAPSAAFSSNSTTLGNRWKHGLWFDNIGGQSGSTLIKTNVNVSVDYGLDISSATVGYQGIRVGNTPALQVAGIGVRQFANGTVSLHLQRFTDSAPTGNILQVTNAANNQILASIDADGNVISAGIFDGFALQVSGGAPIVGAGQISYGATVASSANAGSASALPALPLGYIIINVAGTVAKIPYYAN